MLHIPRFFSVTKVIGFRFPLWQECQQQDTTVPCHNSHVPVELKHRHMTVKWTVTYDSHKQLLQCTTTVHIHVPDLTIIRYQNTGPLCIQVLQYITVVTHIWKQQKHRHDYTLGAQILHHIKSEQANELCLCVPFSSECFPYITSLTNSITITLNSCYGKVTNHSLQHMNYQFFN